MPNLETGPGEIQPRRTERPAQPKVRPTSPRIDLPSGRLSGLGLHLPSLMDEIPERFGGGADKPPKKPPVAKRPDRDPEGEHKFKVKIEDAREIFDQLKQPTPHQSAYMFGSSPMDNPLESIRVSGISDGEKLSSLVQFSFPFELKYGESREEFKEVPFAEDYLAERFKIKKIGSDIIILDNNSKPEFQISIEKVLKEMQIGVGRDRHFGTGLAPLKRLTTFPDFKTWVERYASVIEITTNAVYEGAKQWSPEVELTFRPQMKDRNESSSTQIGDLMARMGGQSEALKDKLQVEKPNIRFDDIGGQEKGKREIQGLAFALKNPELYKKWGTKPPKGVLLYGPPGTGKTLMAKALATEADAQFLAISVSDITSKWYGESEKLMQEVFDIANDSDGRTILFFDEVDAIAPDRGASSEASKRIVSTLLTNLDGIGSNPNVMMVCATNQLDAIDPALTRPGRLDRLVEVGLPDEEGRKQIFGIHIKKAEEVAGRELFNGIDLEQVITKTEKTSGADIAEIVRRVLEEKVRQEGTTGIEPGIITTEEIMREIEGYERVKQVKKTIGFQVPK